VYDFALEFVYCSMYIEMGFMQELLQKLLSMKACGYEGKLMGGLIVFLFVTALLFSLLAETPKKEMSEEGNEHTKGDSNA